MIVEGTIVVATVSWLLVEPIKTVLMANTVMEATLDKPAPRKIEQGDREAEVFLDDFVDDEGNVHTQFLIGKTDDGDWRLFSEAEIELKKQVSFLEAALKKGLPVGPESVKKIIGLVRKRDKEIRKAKSRKVKMKQKELSLAARKAQKRLSRAA